VIYARCHCYTLLESVGTWWWCNMSAFWHANRPNGQLAKSEVISLTSLVIYSSLDLLTTTCNPFSTVSTACVDAHDLETYESLHILSECASWLIGEWHVSGLTTNHGDGVAVVQEPFPSVREPKVHRPVYGDSLTLNCQPPYGYPPGIVYWGESKAGDKLKPIENNERVSLDYDGTYFVTFCIRTGVVAFLNILVV